MGHTTLQLLTLELEDEFHLIGIHSTEEDYRLAYLMNTHLNTRLARFPEALDFIGSEASFPLFEYKDEKAFIDYYLINNKYSSLVKRTDSGSLFQDEQYETSYLVPERHTCDFFLKISGNCQGNTLTELIGKLNAIDQVITSYEIDPDQLKSKDHLIF